VRYFLGYRLPVSYTEEDILIIFKQVEHVARLAVAGGG
jgi:hypothetical protein